jgi:hypothetical protein
MKTDITFRSTLSNASWAQRIAVAALLLVVLMFTLTLALSSTTRAPTSPSTAHQAAPAARNPNVPVIGTGSAYDGGSYVTRRPAVRNPNVPVIGTGSAYDGQ